MRHLTVRRAAPWLGVVMSMVALLGVTAPVAAAGELPGHHGGRAWATSANATSGEIAVQLGRSAFQVCPCNGTNGTIISNTVDTVRAGRAFRAAGTEATAQADKLSNGTAYTTMVAELTDVRALDGAVTADLIRARAVVRANSDALGSTSKGSRLVGLRVFGEPVDVRPRARVDVPGYGHLVVRDVRRGGNGTTLRTISVVMLRIVITEANALDIPVGTQIIVGHADALYSRPDAVGLVSGVAHAWDADSRAASVRNRVGRAAAIYMGCLSRGELRMTNNVNRTDVPGVFINGTGVTTLRGLVDNERALARGTSRIENVDLLDGLITADVVRGVARAQRLAGGSRSVSYAGSRFVNLRINGTAVGDDVQPDTQVAVPGVGTLTLYDTNTSRDPRRIRGEVVMIHLKVNTANSYGLPVGTVLRVGYVRATVFTP